MSVWRRNLMWDYGSSMIPFRDQVHLGPEEQPFPAKSTHHRAWSVRHCVRQCFRGSFCSIRPFLEGLCPLQKMLSGLEALGLHSHEPASHGFGPPVPDVLHAGHSLGNSFMGICYPTDIAHGYSTKREALYEIVHSWGNLFDASAVAPP